jgi:glycerol-1-phosphate dehydrogenase [NAD(P)+]
MTAAQEIQAAVARSRNVAEVLTGAGVLSQVAALYRRQFGSGPACIIADENTWGAAGERIAAALTTDGIAVRVHILPGHPRPKPTVELADALRAVLAQDGATPIAVGSGVLNDVVKHAAFGLDRPYLCAATAASMDGYTSAGAPLSERGFKKTIQCRPALAVLGDLDVIAAAPRQMTGWGYGDMAGKVPAGGDWILADALGIEPIDTVAWPMVQGPLRGWLSDPAGVARGARHAIEGLFAGLTMVGLAMEAHGTSRPASGADHQIAHLWEMDDLKQDGERVSHGACVAVGCAMTLRLYDWLLTQDLTRLDVATQVARAPEMAAKIASIRAAFGPGEIAERAIEETRTKHLEPAELYARLTRVAAIWPDIRHRLAQQLIPERDMRDALHLAGAPSDAAEIGVGRDYLRRTALNARFLRSRYTVLDLLDETGLLAQAVEAALPAFPSDDRQGLPA